MQHIQRSMIKIAEEQAKDEVWSKVISWVEQGHVPEKTKTRGKARKVLLACSMIDSEIFKMKDGVLMFTKAAFKNRRGVADRPPRVHGKGGLDFMSSERSGRAKEFRRYVE